MIDDSTPPGLMVFSPDPMIKRISKKRIWVFHIAFGAEK